MRTIERNFNKIKKLNENWSDYVCLSEALVGRKFSRRRIYYYFEKLVNPNDYCLLDKNRLVRHLYLVSKRAEECTFLDKNRLRDDILDTDEPSVMSTTLLPTLVEIDHILL